jgi:hypothetical protein
MKSKVKRRKTIKGELGSYKAEDFKVEDKVLYVVTYTNRTDHLDNQQGIIVELFKGYAIVDYGNNILSPTKYSRLVRIIPHFKIKLDNDNNNISSNK